jgi:hypothetical protein
MLRTFSFLLEKRNTAVKDMGAISDASKKEGLKVNADKKVYVYVSSPE